MTQLANGISVIICTYTAARLSDLLAAIQSAQQQNMACREIIVVVDHNPELLRIVRERMPEIVVAENVESPGLSGARNSGIALAKSDIIAFLDDDAIASPDWLRLLWTAFGDPWVLGIGGTVIPLWQRQRPLWLPEEFFWVIGCTYRGLPQTPRTIRNPIGANMSFRRDIFNAVGGFRSDIGRVGTRPVGCEETELCIRAQQRWPQGKFIYIPQAAVYHRVPVHRSRWRYFCSRCYAEGLSKAIVTRYVGARDSLASERTFTLFTLPCGVARGIIDGLFHFDMSGFLRAGAILTGLLMTASGYLIGSAFLLVVGSRRDSNEMIPGRISDIPHPIKSQSEA